MRIALIGATGQLGSDLQPALSADVLPLGHDRIEITDLENVRRAFDEIRPEFVINCAAYNFVDRAEEEPQAAYAVNALGPRNLAIECGARRIPLLHVSSDYVFGADRTRTLPYAESDLPGPLGAYAVSKLAGEQFVQAHCPEHFIVRTCGLYGLAASRGKGKGNFVETMLRLGSQRPRLTVVDDQCCTPTSTADLARAIAALVPTRRFGLYHATSSGQTTWCGLAREIFRLTNSNVVVQPITTAAFGAKAGRPAFSVLDCNKLEATIGWRLPDWREALAAYLGARGK